MNKRKKVSLLYFLEQSIKSLWRNGVMTFASVAVLLSCLVVLGSFVLLLVNVNYNVQNIGTLNYILVFVDTDRDPSLSTEEVDDAFTIEQSTPETSSPSSVVGDAEGGAQVDGDGTKQSESELIRVRGLWDDMSDADVAQLGSKYDGDEITSLQSGVLSSVEELRDFTDLAKARTEVEELRERFASVLSYENLGIGRLIYQLPTTLCEMFLKEVFKRGTIEALDRETLITIQAFFENNLNVSETSRKLFVHRNTLVYRLDKIKKMTGLDLRQFDHAITFKVALMVHKYMTQRPVKY